MAATILGLDIGGANLKAATADKWAISVPFPLWKQPDKLAAALAELVAKFPEVDVLAVTMTGELCDCFETKRDGVHAIIKAVRFASSGRRIRVWSTDGAFLDTEEAKAHHLKVAAANWHALATFAGRYVPEGRAILIDVGSTTTDVIPIRNGVPIPRGKTDPERLDYSELVYAGARRTPVCAVTYERVARELFATTLDVYLFLEMIPEEPTNTDTADGRPATRAHALARLCRMLGGDVTTVSADRVAQLARDVVTFQGVLLRGAFKVACDTLSRAKGKYTDPVVIASGAGEFLAVRFATGNKDCRDIISLTKQLGPDVSACAPAYAVAVLATERP
jgi:probable H4MPT-linked C1 transfer pathway protein